MQKLLPILGASLALCVFSPTHAQQATRPSTLPTSAAPCDRLKLAILVAAQLAIDACEQAEETGSQCDCYTSLYAAAAELAPFFGYTIGPQLLRWWLSGYGQANEPVSVAPSNFNNSTNEAWSLQVEADSIAQEAASMACELVLSSLTGSLPLVSPITSTASDAGIGHYSLYREGWYTADCQSGIMQITVRLRAEDRVDFNINSYYQRTFTECNQQITLQIPDSWGIFLSANCPPAADYNITSGDLEYNYQYPFACPTACCGTIGTLQTLENNGGIIGSAGDFNADGTNDIIVGDPDWNSGRGRALVVSGQTGEFLWQTVTNADLTALGCAVAGPGDVNGDGYSDVVVGAHQFWSNGPGYIRVYSGMTGSLLYARFGDFIGDFFGTSVSGLGDVDGDGFEDFVVGASQSTRSRVVQYERWNRHAA